MDHLQLSDRPTLYPDCCCSISRGLIQTLLFILPSDPELTISVGCGSGLLEALLLRESPKFNLHGVEVSSSVNRYLPEERMQLVPGTWALASSARDASAWIFVYPREVQLIKKYIQSYGKGVVRQIIWIGPLADREEVETMLLEQGWNTETTQSIGHGSVILETRSVHKSARIA